MYIGWILAKVLFASTESVLENVEGTTVVKTVILFKAEII